MKFNIITLFSEAFSGFLSSGLLAKAIEKNIVEVNLIHLRDFSNSKHKQVDDYPYGGGPGMVLKIEPLHKALCSIQENSLKILLTPRGHRLKQKYLHHWADQVKQKKYDSITLLCGHYEGFDERITNYIDLSISLGDFVLSGGEVAAMALVEAMARLEPGFMSNANSLEHESFKEAQYLEYAQYTRPPVYDGHEVPEILLSGNHQNIKKWRIEEGKTTFERLFTGDQNKAE